MIEFGTGGWRAIIADGFTKSNVQQLAQAVALDIKNPEVVIGYDRRFLSDVAAKWFSGVLAANGVKVHFIDHAAPTPQIMFAVQQMDLDYGIAITASHNPATYNGIKVFVKDGKDATEKDTKRLENILHDGVEVKSISFEEGLDNGYVSYYNPQNDYIDKILSFIDMSAIRKANLKVLVDTMYGVSKTSLSIILNTTRCELDVINDRHDTLFGGKLPSPSAATLHKLSDMVKASNYDLGIATDGDADRLGIIDNNGKFIHPNTLLSLIYYYLLSYKKWSGPAARNLSTTHMLDRIAKAYGQEVIETPVGFKHITYAMENNGAIIGGESSGGLTIQGHIHGKDGIFAASLLVEMIAVTGKSIHELVEELYEKFGELYTVERDYKFSQAKKEQINNILMKDKSLPDFHNEVERVSYMDGLKVYFTDGSWVSARFSGTEPLLRIFSETETNALSVSYVETLETFLDIKAM
ncbi:phosphonomutase [Erysipelotrichaceae bacterium MTC7]|nr:phosphonomutase [Erysipelotrichaceae bacterium MTC7]